VSLLRRSQLSSARPERLYVQLERVRELEDSVSMIKMLTDCSYASQGGQYKEASSSYPNYEASPDLLVDISDGVHFKFRSGTCQKDIREDDSNRA
jgi:hypothetical protein